LRAREVRCKKGKSGRKRGGRLNSAKSFRWKRGKESFRRGGKKRGWISDKRRKKKGRSRSKTHFRSYGKGKVVVVPIATEKPPKERKRKKKFGLSSVDQRGKKENGRWPRPRKKVGGGEKKKRGGTSSWPWKKKANWSLRFLPRGKQTRKRKRMVG